MRSALSLALLAAILTIPASYAVLRAYDVLFGHEPNPATVIWSPRIAMFWRLGIGAYAAGMTAPLAFFAARANVERTVTALAHAAMVIAAMIALQGIFLP